MASRDLLNIVRSLDRTGVGENGENLQLLWDCLASSSESRYHAAEESILRWLLKSMNGPSAGSETLRRFPISWTIFARVFQRVPLFSLAKSLADRRFISVLQQTLKEVSNPAAASNYLPSVKRKRSPAVKYSLVDLQQREGCLLSAEALFLALQSLFSRLEEPVSSEPRDKIGAEHIKSLFGVSAADAVLTVGPILTICSELLASGERDGVEGDEFWIAIMSSIWDLHLRAHGDAIDVAIHLFRPSALILADLNLLSSNHKTETWQPWKTRWVNDLQRFMHQNLILPGRTAFLNHQGMEVLTRALEVSRKVSRISVPVLYSLCTTASDPTSKGELGKGGVQWYEDIFRLLERFIGTRKDRNTLMRSLLQQAIRQSTPVHVQDLRRVCREYALQDTEIDWSLVALIATCDPDVFQLSVDGVDLRRDVCARTLELSLSANDSAYVLDTIRAIREGFKTRRSFSSFLKLWYEQLCEVEKQGSNQSSPWLQLGRGAYRNDSLDSLLESELSPSQLVDVLTWVKERRPTSSPNAVCIFSSTIALVLTQDSFVDSAAKRLFDLVADLNRSSDTAALRWRVVSRTLAWTAPSERLELWAVIKDRLSESLTSSPVKSAETFEAYKCCFQIWDSMSADGESAMEPASLALQFMDRLSAEMSCTPPRVEQWGKLMPFSTFDPRTELDDELAHLQYLSWFVYGSCRLSKLYTDLRGNPPPILLSALSAPKASLEWLQVVWEAILCNDINLNERKLIRPLVDRLIVALGEVEKEKGWPGDLDQMYIKILASLPLDVFNRWQREQIMGIFGKRRAAMMKYARKVSLKGWKLVLNLMTKLMARPTYPEGMRFVDLVEIADALAHARISSSAGDETFIEVIGSYSAAASATIEQMANQIDERSIRYFREASEFASQCNLRSKFGENDTIFRQPLHMTLLQTLATELGRCPSLQNHEELVSLVEISRQALANSVFAVMKRFMGDDDLFVTKDVTETMSLFAAVEGAASSTEGLIQSPSVKKSAVRKLDSRSRIAMRRGDVRGWKVHAFIRTYFAAEADMPQVTKYDHLEKLPSLLRESLLREVVISVAGRMSTVGKLDYLKELVDELGRGWDTDGQMLAIEAVVDMLTEPTDCQRREDGFDLAAAHSALTSPSLLRRLPEPKYICRTVRTLLEKRPQAMGQWNVDRMLSTVAELASEKEGRGRVSFLWLCSMVEVILKKHRLRLEGHYHLLLSAMQGLLIELVTGQQATEADEGVGPVASAKAYSRLVTLICEPTAGAASRSQSHGVLDSATEAAKRSAGRQMYPILMQYVKLQLEERVTVSAQEALAVAMSSIMNITPPEVRKILNDALDGSGRAMLRELFKKYLKFGKWSGV